MRLFVCLATVAAVGSIAIGTSSAEPTKMQQPDRSHLLPLPRWLVPAEKRTLKRVFGGATPIHIAYIPYPKKIAVIFEFNRIVICGACSAPSNASLPRGRVIRVSYDRQTHLMGGAMQFCEARGAKPPRALCLRR